LKSAEVGLTSVAESSAAKVRLVDGYNMKSINACAPGGHIRGEHHRLAVLHLAGDPGVLRSHPHRLLTRLELGGFIDGQHRVRGEILSVSAWRLDSRRGVPLVGQPHFG
jgi:hypothetical protein